MRIIRAAAALAAALSIGLGVAGPATATAPHLEPGTVCVLPDFTVTGSGWRVQAAVAEWADAQQLVALTMVSTPDCVPVVVHEYDGGPLCCYAVFYDDDGDGAYDRAEVYLNQGWDDRFYSPRFSRFVVAQELGRAMGLAPSSVKGSVMFDDYAEGRGAVVTREDVRVLAALYRP